MPILLQVALLMGVAMVVVTLSWMLLNWIAQRNNTHVRLIREVMSQFEYTEETVRLGRTLEATKHINGVNVELDFGLSLKGFEVLAIQIDLSPYLNEAFQLLSKNHDRVMKTRGMGDPHFDEHFACLMESAQGVSFLESGLRRRLVELVQLASGSQKHLVRITMGKLVIERMQEIAESADDLDITESFFHHVEALALHLAEWVKRDPIAQLEHHVRDDQPMAWRCEALRLFWTTCDDEARRRQMFTLLMASGEDVLALKEIAYLYASEQFELALWASREQWRTQIIWALEHTQHQQAIKRIGKWFFEEYDFSVFDQFDPNSVLHVNLLRAATLSQPPEVVLAYFQPRLLSGSPTFKQRVLEIMVDTQMLLPLGLLNQLMDNWQTYSTRVLNSNTDELPAILRAMMLWHPDLIEERIQSLLPYPSPRVRSMLLDWLYLYGTQRSLFQLHRLHRLTGSGAENRRTKEVIASIMERLDQLPQGALSLSSIDDMHGQLSMLDVAGGVSMVQPHDDPEDSGEVIFDLQNDLVFESYGTDEYEVEALTVVKSEET